MMSVAHFLFAMGGAPAGASPEEQKRAMLMQVPVFIFVAVILYVLMIRPQQKLAKQQKELLKALKKGDKVVTSSGIIGIITNVTDDLVTIRSADTKLDLQKSAVTQITGRAEA